MPKGDTVVYQLDKLAAPKDDHLKMFIASILIRSHERYKSMQVTKMILTWNPTTAGKDTR